MVLIQHDEGRIVAERNESGTFTGYEYQYNLKDHLGNVRTTFKTDIDSDDIYLATLETAYATTEEGQFGNLPTTRETDAVYNHTPADATVTSPNKSAMLNASLTNADGTRRVVGPTMSLHVFPGDTVDMEVYAKYANTCGVSETTASAFLFASLAAASGISAVGETAKAYQALDGATGAAALFDQSSCDVPKAFLNYILFDKNFSNPTIGFVQVSSTAGTQFEELSLSKSINKEGYLYIYVSNESTLNANVYFDDMKVTHKHTPIVQKDDYYPFGLQFNSYKKPGLIAQNYKYNGKEEINDLDLNWQDYGARMYMADLGRMGTIDPKGESVHNWTLSPYHYTNNNPILYVDVNGEDWFVSNSSGAVMNIKGVSEWSLEALAKEYGQELGQAIYDLGGTSDSWENFGSDDMFDTEDNKISEGLGSLTVMGVEESENFMSDQGFIKSDKITISEQTAKMTDYSDFGEKIETETTISKIKNQRITYATVNELYEEQTTFEQKAIDYGAHASIRERIYTVKVFHGTGYDKVNRSSTNSVKSIVQTILSEVVEKLFKGKRK